MRMSFFLAGADRSRQKFYLAVHILKGLKALFRFGLGVTVAHKAHGDKAQRHKGCGVGEEYAVVNGAHQAARDNGGHDLRGHREGVIIPGKLADVTAAAHLHDHRQRVDIDGCPARPTNANTTYMMGWMEE